VPPPPPPPTCPPPLITGNITGDYYDEHYYSTYSAPLVITEYGNEYSHNNPDPENGHTVHAILWGPPGGFWVKVFWHVNYGADYNFEKYVFPFEWCTHQDITITDWDDWSPEDATTTLRLIW